MAVRYGQGGWPGLRQDLVASSRIFAVGRKELRGRRRAAFAPDELRAFVLLHEDDGGLWRRWFAAAGRRRRQCQPRAAHPRNRTGSRCRGGRTGHRPGRRGVDRGRPRPRPAREALRRRPGRRRLLSAQPRQRAAAAPARRLPRLAAGGDGVAALTAVHWQHRRLCRPAPLAVIVAAASRVTAEGDIEVGGGLRRPVLRAAAQRAVDGGPGIGTREADVPQHAIVEQ